MHLLSLLLTIRRRPAMFEPFVAHSIRSFTDSAERLAARNSRIKVNFARLTHNQCSTCAPTLTRTDPRLSRTVVDTDTAVRMVSGNSALPRSTTNYMHFIARRSERCNSVQFLATALAPTRCFILVFRTV